MAVVDGKSHVAFSTGRFAAAWSSTRQHGFCFLPQKGPKSKSLENLWKIFGKSLETRQWKRLHSLLWPIYNYQQRPQEKVSRSLVLVILRPQNAMRAPSWYFFPFWEEHLGFLGSFLGLSEMDKLGVSKNEIEKKDHVLGLWVEAMLDFGVTHTPKKGVLHLKISCSHRFVMRFQDAKPTWPVHFWAAWRLRPHSAAVWPHGCGKFTWGALDFDIFLTLLDC